MDSTSKSFGSVTPLSVTEGEKKFLIPVCDKLALGFDGDFTVALISVIGIFAEPFCAAFF